MTAATAERVTIQVTQEHIDHGKAGDCAECPVARAFLGAVPDLQRVAVWDAGCARADLYFGPVDPVVILLPEVVTDFVSAFDDGRPVSPFSFDVEVDW